MTGQESKSHTERVAIRRPSLAYGVVLMMVYCIVSGKQINAILVHADAFLL